MIEQTFIFIKPEHVNLADKIFSELDNYGHRIKTVRIDNTPKEIIENHYFPHKDRPFYHFMVSSFIGKPIILAIYEGEGILQKFIDIIGPTDPSKAPAHTIRGKYSDDSLEKAIAEQRPVRNVIHRSDSPEEFIREIEVWKKYLEK